MVEFDLLAALVGGLVATVLMSLMMSLAKFAGITQMPPMPLVYGSMLSGDRRTAIRITGCCGTMFCGYPAWEKLGRCPADQEVALSFRMPEWLQIQTPGAMVSNPAMLAGAAGIMAQLAMQQQMDEIADYLATIDQKLDAVLRSQTNQVLARLDGVDLAVREAMSVREAVGRVSEVTWSKVQNSATIHETEGYALRQLGDLADKIEEKNKIGDLVETAKEVETDVQKWLVVLARCFHLHDAVAVLELDRVLDASPDERDRHRLGLTSARGHRLELISERTEHLLGRMNAAVGMANSKVLLNPKQSPAVVKSSNHVVAGVHKFHDLLGIESGRKSSEARRWSEAAGALGQGACDRSTGHR